MADAWCWGAWRFGAVRCGGGVRPLFDSRAPERDGWRWCTDDGRGFHFWVCAGCFARENPHATGPHTRIVEEWEHEYGALCRVVVGPLLYPFDGLGERVDEYVLEEWERMGPDAAGVVPGFSRHIHASNPDTVSKCPSVSRAASLRDAVALAHADAERLALEWSPPVDEEAA